MRDRMLPERLSESLIWIRPNSLKPTAFAACHPQYKLLRLQNGLNVYELCTTVGISLPICSIAQIPRKQKAEVTGGILSSSQNLQFRPLQEMAVAMALISLY